MKKIFYLLIFSLSLQAAFAQDDQPGEGKLREKMIQYIQNKLSLSREEAEKFQPVFVDYLKELRQTNKTLKAEGKGALELQQKIVDLRVRYRDQFKTIIGEKRSNEVFDHEKEFIKTVVKELQDRNEQRQERRAAKEKNSKLLSN